MNTNTLLEQRNKLMHDYGTLMQSNDTLTTEQRSTADKLYADIEQLNGDVQRSQRADEMRAAESRSTRPPRPELGNENANAHAEGEKRAFTEYVRTGTISAENAPYAKRDMTTGTSSGGVLVPTGFDPQLSLAVKSAGEIAGSVRFLRTESGNPIKVGLGDLTAGLMVVQGTEGTASTEADIPVSGQISNVDTLSTYVTISNQLIQDSYFDINDFVQTALGEAYAQTVAKSITLGNSTNFASLTASAVNTVTAASSITYDNLVDHFSSLNARYRANASYLLNTSTWGALMKIVDGENRPVLQSVAGNGGPNSAPFSTLFGLPIQLSSYSNPVAAGNAGVVLLGDWKRAYTWRQAGQLTIARLDQVKALTLETVFLAVVRAGGYSTVQTSSPSAVALSIAAS